MSGLASSDRSGALAAHEVGELVFSRDIPQGASLFECLRLVWEEARSEARATYEAWRGESGLDAYVVYRAAQDRADAAEDALARHAGREDGSTLRDAALGVAAADFDRIVDPKTMVGNPHRDLGLDA